MQIPPPPLSPGTVSRLQATLYAFAADISGCRQHSFAAEAAPIRHMAFAAERQRCCIFLRRLRQRHMPSCRRHFRHYFERALLGFASFSLSSVFSRRFQRRLPVRR
jgi:hypothetical protein